MKKYIELEVDIDLEEILRESGSREEAFTMLNYRLEKNRKKVQKELQVKFDEMRAEFEKELTNICEKKNSESGLDSI